VVFVQSSYWSFNLYPEAGEGGGCLVRAARPLATAGPPNVERSRREASRRARAKLRRYCAANRLNRLATLTYAGEGCFDAVQLRSDVAEFFRGLRSELGGQRFAYAWTSEWHPGGHGLHVHFTVGRYVRERLIRQVWGRGITHIKRIQDLPVGSGAVEEARRAAGYLAKYVSKSLGEDPTPGCIATRSRRASSRVWRRSRGVGGCGDRGRVRANGRRAGAGLALVDGGGLACAAGVLVCLGRLTTYRSGRPDGQRRQRSRKGCRRGSRI
jgi:hypothetical protein